MQIFFWGKRDGVQHEIQVAPMLFNLAVQRFPLTGNAHSVLQDQFAGQTFAERTHIRLGFFIHLGYR